MSLCSSRSLYDNFSRQHDRDYLAYVREHTPVVKKDARVPRSLKIKMDMCNLSPNLFKWVTLSRRKKFLEGHKAFRSGNDWESTFKQQGIG